MSSPKLELADGNSLGERRRVQTRPRDVGDGIRTSPGASQLGRLIAEQLIGSPVFGIRKSRAASIKGGDKSCQKFLAFAPSE
ncbi:MAG: hypothetical protein AB4040_14770 [Synechococcus sp.]